MDALGPKLGFADYQPVVDDIRKKLRSSTRAAKKFGSQLQRQTARSPRIIATRDDQKREWLKTDGNGDVGFLRWECVEQMFPDVVWDTPCIA